MSKYFLELCYMGTNHSGFQVQPTVPTIQGEVERVIEILLKTHIPLTTSSRTDAGVHAHQNFFHFDTAKEVRHKMIYNLNAMLPKDISIANIYKVDASAHCRFDAVARKYRYYIYGYKDPFISDRAWYYPFKTDLSLLNQAADLLKQYEDFTSFSKRSTDVKTFICHIQQASWAIENGCLVFTVESNRFLRGMVRALVATMLKVGRGTLTLADLRRIIESKNCANADFSAPGKGLFLEEVRYPYKLTAVE